jgi:hypothetical protein
MEDVAGQVEGKRLLEARDPGEIILDFAGVEG